MSEQNDLVQTRFDAGALDPQVAEFLRQAEREPEPPLAELTPAEARETFSRNIIDVWVTKSPDPVARVESRAIPGPEGEIPLRVYTPEGEGPFPILLFIHGGGWVICSLDTHDTLCRALCMGAGCLVVSVDYRLAPEHKYPAAVHDVYAALEWVAAHGGELGGDPARIAVGGDSAGGNLSAALALLARDRGGPALVYQLLLYPVANAYAMDTLSYRDYAEGYMLLKSDMLWYRNHYLAQREDGLEPYASPLLCPDLGGLPPAHVITAEYDVLRDEGEAYARRLREAGNAVTCTRYNGLIHGFMSMDGLLDKAGAAIAEAAEVLRAAFEEK
jgi:acetyl esterase